jgi:hypothetical protein
MNDVVKEKKTRNRVPKIYVVQMNGEKHLIRARSAYGALKFAVSETTSVTMLGLKEVAALAEYLSAGGQILDATSVSED